MDNVLLIIEKIEKELNCDSDHANALYNKLHCELLPSLIRWAKNEDDDTIFCGYTIRDIMEKDNCTKLQAIVRLNYFIDKEDMFLKYMSSPHIRE